MNIFDLINAREISTYYTSNGSEKIPMLGATLFPSKKQLGLDLSWIKGSKGLPVALMPAVFDTKAAVRDRIGVTKVETEMPFFRESMRIGEKDRQEINKAAAANNAAMVEPVINKIFDDVTGLVDGGDVQAERMRMQLLSTGKINITADRVDYQYDYKLAAAQKETLAGTAKWSDTTNSDPVADIVRWQDDREDATGTRPTRAICTRKSWNYLLKNSKIKQDINVVEGSKIILTDKLLKAYLLDKVGLEIAVYNKKFKNEAGTATLYFPDDVFTLLPDGNMGNTYYGTTPEESDLMAGNTDAQVEIVNTGVAITTVKEAHPVNVMTIVSEICLPSFETIDNIFIATVHS